MWCIKMIHIQHLVFFTKKNYSLKNKCKNRRDVYKDNRDVYKDNLNI